MSSRMTAFSSSLKAFFTVWIGFVCQLFWSSMEGM
jgi:hypothetical protein